MNGCWGLFRKEEKDVVSFSTKSYIVSTSPLPGDAAFLPTCTFGFFVENLVGIRIWAGIRVLSFIPFFNLSAFMAVPCCILCCSSTIKFKNQGLFYLRHFYYCSKLLWLSWVFCVSIWIFSISVKNCVGFWWELNWICRLLSGTIFTKLI